ncbi:MAG: hypothetical protein KAY82_03560 [Hylemonella sp.]|jgi:hypothetical protein|nr:hypothetical protein [Hylemonella sp.]
MIKSHATVYRDVRAMSRQQQQTLGLTEPDQTLFSFASPIDYPPRRRIAHTGVSQVRRRAHVTGSAAGLKRTGKGEQSAATLF